MINSDIVQLPLIGFGVLLCLWISTLPTTLQRKGQAMTALAPTVPSPDGAQPRKLLDLPYLRRAPSPAVAAEPGKRWYVGAQNDGLFIVNAEPRPSNDYPWHDNPNGPTVALNVTELPLAKAQKIVDAMNALATPPVRGDREDLIRRLRAGPASTRDLTAWRALAEEAVDALSLPVQSAPDRDTAAEIIAQRIYGSKLQDLEGVQMDNCRDIVTEILEAGQSGAGEREAARILRGWAEAYRDSPEHRFPSDPNAEFFPVDLECAADLLAPIKSK